MVKHQMEQYLTHIEKRYSKISFSGVQWSLVANSRSSPLQPFGLHKPPSLAAEGPGLQRQWYVRGSLIDMLKQNKGTGTLLAPETGKDIPKQGDKPGTACMNSLFLGKEVFQAPGSSYGVEWAFEILHDMRRPFPTILYWNYLIKYLSSQWTLCSSRSVIRSAPAIQ